MQRHKKMEHGPYTQSELNPLTISDQEFMATRQRFMGYTQEGKPIPQVYKKGRLPRSLAHKNIGRIDLIRALEYSSNPYFSLLAADHLQNPNDLNRAAEAFGVPFTLSTMSINSIEDVAEATTKPFWFQLYTMRDEDYVARLIQRAKDAKCSALVITLDLQILGQRHKDLKNGLSAPPKLTAKTLANLATKWSWGIGMMGAKRRSFGNIVGHVHGVDDTANLGAWTAEQFDPTLDWGKIAKLKEQWGGKVILKGILDADDARMALKVGADAIIVSNHGGRQLDGAISSIRALPSILEAVGDQIEVHLDSGIRSGQDVLKAMAMGAKGTYIGRAFIYGLGAMGQAGVTSALEVIHKELDLSMALCGETSVAGLGKHNLLIPKGFEGDWKP